MYTRIFSFIVHVELSNYLVQLDWSTFHIVLQRRASDVLESYDQCKIYTWRGRFRMNIMDENKLFSLPFFVAHRLVEH